MAAQLFNWYMVTQPGPEGRFAVNRDQLAIHRLSDESQRRVLDNGFELREALTGLFGLTLPDHPNLSATLTRMTTGAI